MTKFKAGDKVRIKDEVLTNEEGDSMWQSWRGTEREVVVAIGSRDFWVKEVDGGNLAYQALLDGKHLELIETFAKGDWVYIKDEPLTHASKAFSSHRLPNRGTWVEVSQTYSDGDLHVWNDSRDELGLVHKRHVTSNPFEVGDRVDIADEALGGAVPSYFLTEDMLEDQRKNPYIVDGPDEDGDVLINGYYVNKRFVTPVKPKIDLPVTVDEINSLADRLAGLSAEAVDHPEHYNRGAFETIDVIEDWGLNFNVGNAVKYISRYEHKGKPKEDLRKAIWYLEREIDSLN